MKTKIKIESIFGKLLFEHEAENNTIRKTLDEAVKSRVNLYEANLRGADLRGANLHEANLREANLYGANLREANLREAGLYGANLREADLCGAGLYGANLHGANLHEANLREANLCGADLRGANLRGANLYGAGLYGANLYGADLREANLREAGLGGNWGKLESVSDILIVGPIGSRDGYTTMFHTDKGVFVMCGCFRGTLEEFAKKVEETHGDNNHARDYKALIELARIKFEL